MNSNIIHIDINKTIRISRSSSYSPYGDRMGIYIVMGMTYDIVNKLNEDHSNIDEWLKLKGEFYPYQYSLIIDNSNNHRKNNKWVIDIDDTRNKYWTDLIDSYKLFPLSNLIENLIKS